MKAQSRAGLQAGTALQAKYAFTVCVVYFFLSQTYSMMLQQANHPTGLTNHSISTQLYLLMKHVPHLRLAALGV
jgi:hypothetical protein